MRVYVHGGDLTVIFKLDQWPDATVADAAAAWAARRARDGGGASADVAAAAAFAFELEDGQRVEGSRRVADVLRDRGDLFLVPDGGGGSGGGSGGSAVAAAVGDTEEPSAALHLTPAHTPAATGNGSVAALKQPPQPPSARARAAELRAALRSNPSDAGAARALAELLLRAGRAREAVPLAARAAAAAAGSSPAAAALAATLLGDCLLDAGDAAGALEAYQDALRLLPDDESSGGSTSEERTDAELRCARALAAAGQPAAAGRIVMAALERTGQAHAGALLLFAELAVATGPGGAADAARVALRLLPGAPRDKRVKAALGQALQVSLRLGCASRSCCA